MFLKLIHIFIPVLLVYSRSLWEGTSMQGTNMCAICSFHIHIGPSPFHLISNLFSNEDSGSFHDGVWTQNRIRWHWQSFCQYLHRTSCWPSTSRNESRKELTTCILLYLNLSICNAECQIDLRELANQPCSLLKRPQKCVMRSHGLSKFDFSSNTWKAVRRQLSVRILKHLVKT